MSLAGEAQPDAELVSALSGLDAGRDRALSMRTQRAVHRAADDMEQGRHVRRRSLAIVLLTLIGLLMLLSPALWNMVDELVGGEFLLDLPGIVGALALTLFAAIAAVLFLIGGDRQLRHSRR
ncbi:MAG TPA: hypothetical protein VGD62_01285 [Acidobacteriaceae bacterium]